MKNTVQFERIDKTKWNALKHNIQVYEMTLPSYTVASKIRGNVGHWKGKPTSLRGYGYQNDEADILEVAKVWTNPKNTIKVVIVGKGWLAVLSRNAGVDGFTSLNFERYSDTPSDVFDSIKEGGLVVVDGRSEAKVKSLLFVADEPTVDDVKGLMDGLVKMHEIRQSYSRFRWQSEQSNVETYGTVTKLELARQRIIFDEALRDFRWIERKDKWDLWNAVKANITLNINRTDLKVKLKALDGSNFSLETTVGEKEELGWREESVYKQSFWIPFVYRDPSDNFHGYPRTRKTEELMNRFMGIPDRLPEASVILGFNTRLVTLTRKKTSKGAVLNYLDGKIVRSDDVVTKIKEFFILGKPILVTPPVMKKGQPKQKLMSRQAQKLIDEGLNGVMRDLEGEFPFHLNIVHKQKERKWYLEIAGKEFYIKGGYNALNKVKNAIAGRGIINHTEDGWDCRGTKVIRRRLGELVGDKNALWIILHVKKMGALMLAMKGGVDN